MIISLDAQRPKNSKHHTYACKTIQKPNIVRKGKDVMVVNVNVNVNQKFLAWL